MPASQPASEPWRICYQQLAPRLLLFARQWLATQADAEDVVQTAFVRFWHNQPGARPEHYPLLYAAVRTAALDLIRTDSRRTRRETSYNDDLTQAGAAFFEHSIEQKEEAELAELALRQLPEEQREVLVLRIWGELTFAEIATALEQNINTVAGRYRQGLEALRRILTPHFNETV